MDDRSLQVPTFFLEYFLTSGPCRHSVTFCFSVYSTSKWTTFSLLCLSFGPNPKDYCESLQQTLHSITSKKFNVQYWAYRLLDLKKMPPDYLWSLGQGDIHLTKWLVRMPCKLGAWGSRPPGPSAPCHTMDGTHKLHRNTSKELKRFIIVSLQSFIWPFLNFDVSGELCGGKVSHI